jgi:pyridoxal 5'-phosphate synthase pdxT subunit
LTIGVLALQGAFIEHLQTLSKLNASARPVRLPRDLEGLSGIIIPGGESTSIGKLLADYSLFEPIKKLAQRGFPVWGTCAGMILLAKEIVDSKGAKTFGLMDIGVRRNAYGRQVDSFEVDLDVAALGDKIFHGVFIRAPLIEYTKPNVEVLCRHNDRAVFVRQGRILACSFHPELTDDHLFHSYFLDIVNGGDIAKGNNR